jgi:hypothetical protein
VKSGGCDNEVSENLNAQGFKIISCTPASRYPVQLVRYFYSWRYTRQVISCLWVGHVIDAYLGGEEGIGGSELAAGVGDGDGQPGSNARARRSLAVDQPCESRVSLGGDVKS